MMNMTHISSSSAFSSYVVKLWFRLRQKFTRYGKRALLITIQKDISTQELFKTQYGINIFPNIQAGSVAIYNVSCGNKVV